MVNKIVWLSVAENNLYEIHDYYYLKAGQKVAANLVQGIIQSTEILKSNPNIGMIEPLIEAKSCILRYRIFKNYKIVYRVEEELNQIEIVLVFDTRRDPIHLRNLNI